MDALGSAVAARWPAPVAVSYLDHHPPYALDVLRGYGSGPVAPVVVPALMTRAFHGRVDFPQVVASSGAAVRMTPVFGPQEPGEAPDPLLVAALLRRLAAVPAHYDGVVLAAAGTRDVLARSIVDAVAGVVAATLGAPCVPAYASAAPPTGAEAVGMLRERHAVRRPVVASYFLAPGKLHDIVAASARRAGAVGVSAPLGDVAELVDLIIRRATSAAASEPVATPPVNS